MRALVYKSEGVFKEREAPLPGGINLKKITGGILALAIRTQPE